ncbi:MAG: hypothetical protein OJF47_000355 [Nitrospira sp.]|nr:MAG: hypothetical protein OJF47_000355 [Nitrospira sp.]
MGIGLQRDPAQSIANPEAAPSLRRNPEALREGSSDSFARMILERS